MTIADDHATFAGDTYVPAQDHAKTIDFVNSHFAGRAWQEWRWPGCQDPCGQPLVPTGIHDLFESFRIRSST